MVNLKDLVSKGVISQDFFNRMNKKQILDVDDLYLRLYTVYKKGDSRIISFAERHYSFGGSLDSFMKKISPYVSEDILKRRPL